MIRIQQEKDNEGSSTVRDPIKFSIQLTRVVKRAKRT